MTPPSERDHPVNEWIARWRSAERVGCRCGDQDGDAEVARQPGLAEAADCGDVGDVGQVGQDQGADVAASPQQLA